MGKDLCTESPFDLFKMAELDVIQIKDSSYTTPANIVINSYTGEIDA